MKRFRKLLALLLSVAMLTGHWSGVSVQAADYSNLVDFTVEVESGRDIRVLQLTDTQILDAAQVRTQERKAQIDSVNWDTEKMNLKLFNAARQVIESYNPDLIIITGDLIYGEFDDNGTSLIRLINFMDSFQIPWAPVFGNHDAETKRGIDWVCDKLEASPYCLFEQKELTGNGNYSVGLVQGGELVRVFYMLDSNGGGSMSNESFSNGHSRKQVGFGNDQISWYTDSINSIKGAYPNTKFSMAFHIQLQVWNDALVKYGFTNNSASIDNPINLDETGADGDFGYLGRKLKDAWDTDYTVWNGIKALGVDSIFVGHEHCNNASVVYEGVRLGYGLKTGTYDRANYKKADGTIVGSSNISTGEALVGGTAINVASTGEIISSEHIYYKEVAGEGGVNVLSPLYATFKADGVYVGDPIAFEANATRLSNVPAVPTKEGYTGEWEAYSIGAEDMTIDAVYTNSSGEVQVDFKTVWGDTGSRFRLESSAFHNPADDVQFTAVDSNAKIVYTQGTTVVERTSVLWSQWGLYLHVNGTTDTVFDGITEAQEGDMIRLTGVWQSASDNTKYDFGDVYYIYDGTFWNEYISPTEFTITGLKTGADQGYRWLFRFNTSVDIPGYDFSTSMGKHDIIVSDGTTETTYNVSFYSSVMTGHNGLGLLDNYVAIPEDPTGYSFTIPAGTEFLNKYDNVTYRLSEDTTFEYADGSWIMAENAPTITLGLGSGSAAQDDSTRYLVYLTGASLEQMKALHTQKATIYIDGVKTTGKSEYYKLSDTLFTLFVKYDDLESGAKTYASLSPHTIQIKAGTVLGGYRLTDDVTFHTVGNQVKAGAFDSGKEVAFSLGTGSGAQDNSTRYLVYLTGVTTEQMKEMHGKKATLYIDGEKKTGDSEYYKLSDTSFALLLKYADLENGATSYTSLSPHTIQIKAGTYIGDYKVSQDLTFHTKGTTVNAGEYIPENNFTLSLKSGGGAQNDSKRYLIYLEGMTSEQMTAMHGKAATLYIDGEKRTGTSEYYKFSDTSFALFIKYHDLETDITKYENLSPHTVEIRKGTEVGGCVVMNTLSLSLDGGTIAETSTLKSVELSLAETPKSSHQESDQRYLFYLTGYTSAEINDLNGRTMPIYVDDQKVTSASDMACWKTGTQDVMLFTLPYAVLESGVSKAEDLSSHVVEFKKGTIVNGTYIIGKDLTIKLNKTDIAEYVKPNLVNPEVKDAVTAAVSGTVLTLNGTGTIQASDLASVSAASITEIQIEGPCNIASQAFQGFTALKKVWFSNTVLTAASDAFLGCASGVEAIFVAGRNLTGGLLGVEEHPYYSFKILTLGSSHGEDMNNYIYTMAKKYYSSLPGRAAEDIAYDDIVVAELFSGGCPLSDRVNGILDNPKTTGYYEKWDSTGVSIPTVPSGQLTGKLMKTALQDEYWDVVILMQSAADGRNASSFLADTAGNGTADIDTMINFAKANNKNHSGSKYMWLQTWTDNYKLNASAGGYADAVRAEENMRLGIVNSMQTVVQERVDLGALDGIIPAGAAIENLKNSWLNAEDPDYTSSHESGTYNEGNYSNYFAIQRDTTHASIGLGRFSVGLTAFSYLAGLDSREIQSLANACYPKNYAECEVSTKLYEEHSRIFAYLEYDEYTKNCAPQAYSAAVKALADPYRAQKIYMTGDANGDDILNSKDLIRYKKAQMGAATIVDESIADITMDAKLDAADCAALRAKFVE